MRQVRLLLLTALIGAAVSTPAFADATLFIGSTPTPTNRPTAGAALGMSLLIVGFEFEYASASQQALEGAPALTTVMGNAFVQTPTPIAGFQPYLTAGVGGYREALGDLQETHMGFNTGGGVKMALFGPLRVRLDYRLMNLRGEPLHSVVHRVYAGVNVAF